MVLRDRKVDFELGHSFLQLHEALVRAMPAAAEVPACTMGSCVFFAKNRAKVAQARTILWGHELQVPFMVLKDA